jgi:glycosyltransferase involved in cell wall biosynthesis
MNLRTVLNMHDKYPTDMQAKNKNRTLSSSVVRILHVVGGMNLTGIEMWLMHILRYINRDRFQMDFLVHTTQMCTYEDEMRAFGSRIIPCLHPSQPWLYARDFKRILREYGPYDIVHSHIHHYNGFILRLAQQSGIPIRIAHSHYDTSSIEAKKGLLRNLYLALMKLWINRYATVGLGCSRDAVIDLFNPIGEADTRWRVLYYGIDLNPFHSFVDRVAVRGEFGLPADAFVIGHIGRFVEQKNHGFLLDIAAEVAKREPKMRLLMIGEGPLKSGIEQKVVQMGLSDRVIFAGGRSDIPRLMLGAMDLFLFPTLYEGLGLVLIEAQAAGLPCIFSDIVPTEADVIKPLVRRFSLSEPASAWAEAILAAKASSQEIAQTEALRLVEQSSFNIQTSVKELEQLYLEKVQHLFPSAP